MMIARSTFCDRNERLFEDSDMDLRFQVLVKVYPGSLAACEGRCGERGTACFKNPDPNPPY